MSVRLTVLIKKLDTISDADFHAYWSKSHPKIWLSIKVVKERVVKYSQFHVNRQVMDELAAKRLPIVDYDGVMSIWGHSVEDLVAIFQDEEYKRVVVPDEEKFLNRRSAKFLLGHDEDKWVDGKIVEQSKL